MSTNKNTGTPRYVVQTKDAGQWRTYRAGRQHARESDAFRLMDRLQTRWPSAEFRVALSTPEKAHG